MSTVHAALKALGIQAVNSGGSTGKHCWSDHAEGALIQSINPATGEAIAAVRSCAAADYERIVVQAQETFTTWRMVPAPKRGELIRLIGQPLREKKDQLGWVHGVTVGVNPLQTLSLNVGLNFDSQRNVELEQVNRTRVLTLGVNWQPFKGATFASDFSRNLSGDAARTRASAPARPGGPRRSVHETRQAAVRSRDHRPDHRVAGCGPDLRLRRPG